MIPGLKQFIIGLHLTLGTMMESPLTTDRLRRIKMESLKSKALCSPSPIKVLQIGTPHVLVALLGHTLSCHISLSQPVTHFLLLWLRIWFSLLSFQSTLKAPT